MPELTISEIAQLCHAHVQGPSEGTVRGLAALADAQPGDATFLGDVRYRDGLDSTQATCVLIGEETPCERTDLTLLRCADPSASFTKLIEAFAPPQSLPIKGVHPSALIDPSASLDASASIGPLCVVGPQAVIGPGAALHPRVTVGAGCHIGAGSVLHPGVTLYAGTQIGARCILHAGAVIGSDGFGFDPTPEGWVKILQGGRVRIEDDVEIGANSTIDCARFGETLIGRGTKIDNQVHIAHNVRIGAHSLLIAQVGIAGSTHLGEWVIAAGQVGIGGHLQIGAGARLGAGSKVLNDVKGGEDYFGYPAGPKKEALAGLALLPRLRGQLQKLKKRIAHLEERS